jgi:hypothetical protein
MPSETPRTAAAASRVRVDRGCAPSCVRSSLALCACSHHVPDATTSAVAMNALMAFACDLYRMNECTASTEPMPMPAMPLVRKHGLRVNERASNNEPRGSTAAEPFSAFVISLTRMSEVAICAPALPSGVALGGFDIGSSEGGVRRGGSILQCVRPADISAHKGWHTRMHECEHRARPALPCAESLLISLRTRSAVEFARASLRAHTVTRRTAFLLAELQ